MTSAEILPLLLWVFVGVVAGISVGAIPGLTGAMAIALTLPLTFAMDQDSALALLVALYTGSVSGGLISATLLRIPGTPAAIITTLDGFPMAEAGQPGRALGLGIGASFVGGVLSGVCLWLLAKPLAEWSTRMGPFDLFALVAMAMIFILCVSEPGTRGLWKGLFSGMLGTLVSVPGIHPATGQTRYTFGWEELDDGFKLLPVLVGMFAVSQALLDLAGKDSSSPRPVAASIDRVWQPAKVWLRNATNLFRSSAIGTFIGILPGIGANIGSAVAYGTARQFSKAPEEFGHGSEEGLVSSEAANNATVGGALIPLISLGIPGSVIDAILLGAFVIHGLQPGPLLFQNHPETVNSIIIAYFLSNVAMAAVMLFGARWIAKLGGIQRKSLAPLIIVLAFVGSYALGNRFFDVWATLLFGLVGIAFLRFRLPMAPFVIGFVLAPLAEENLYSGLMASGGSFLPILTRPFPLICAAISVILIVAISRANRKQVAISSAPPDTGSA